MEQEIHEFSNQRISKIPNNDLPILLSQQVTKLNQLDISIKKALRAAESANESAAIAKDQSTGFGKKKIAIEQLQSANYDLAKAVHSGSIAQKISFEFQTKLSEISKSLFGLGVSNIASNRFVMRELELKLKGASEEELSELAQQEITTVVKQLKDQEDLLMKMENFSTMLRDHDNTIESHSEFNQFIDRQYHDLKKAELLNQEQWTRQNKITNKLEEQIESHALSIKNLDNQYKKQNKIIHLHDEKLNEYKLIHLRQNEQLKAHEIIYKNQEEINEIHSNKLNDYIIKNEHLEKRLMVQSRYFQKLIDKLSNHIEKHDENLINITKMDSIMNITIKSNKELIEVQEQEIQKLTDELHLLKLQISMKASLKTSKLNFCLVILTFILSIVHFFI